MMEEKKTTSKRIRAAISKRLWPRSGNRCAICMEELVKDKDENNILVSIGQEAHIVSEKTGGPRHIPNFGDYNAYDNLIILCSNHHLAIDQQPEIYTIEYLRSRKEAHEKRIQNAFSEMSQKKVKADFLYRIHDGKELVDLVRNSDMHLFDNDKLTTREEVEIIGGFFHSLEDWGDIVRGIGYKDIIELSFTMDGEIKALEGLGFHVFGGLKKDRWVDGGKQDIGEWTLLTILVVRNDNPKILDKEWMLVVRNLQPYRQA